MDCDVLVVGGGPAGIGAAIGAADAGAGTVILERYGFLGGNITVAGVEVPSWYRQENTTMPGGVPAEIERRMIEKKAVGKVMFRPSTGLSYDTEIFKVMADEMMEEHGVFALYHCFGTVPYLEDGKVAGVITESKSGRTVIRASRVVDCTGDGDIAARAGAPFAMGDAKKHEMMGGTLKFVARDVDIEKLDKVMDEDPEDRDPYVHRLFHRTFDKAAAAGEVFPDGVRPVMHYSKAAEGDISVNLVTWDRELDSTDVLSLTASEKKLRKAAMDVLDIYRRYGGEEGLGEAKLRNFYTAVGVRESRRFISDYVLSSGDIRGLARFEDSVGVFPLYMDGENVKAIPFGPEYFQIPFRILVPGKVRNLLIAGRCVSCTRDAVPTTREMDFCMICGQAAGAASALSIRQGRESAGVDIAALQKELERQGVRVF